LYILPDNVDAHMSLSRAGFQGYAVINKHISYLQLATVLGVYAYWWQNMLIV